PETERDVLKGTTVHLPVYADATYFFLFRTMGSGITVAISTLSSELAAGGARTDGSLVKAALAATSPADILLQPIFNPVGGYASYVVPAAFVLILQQMLLIGAAMLTGAALAQATGGVFASVLGRGIAHLIIYLPALALYFIMLPRFYGFSTLGQPLQLFAIASVFVLATSFMGQAVGAWFKRPETPTLIFVGSRQAEAGAWLAAGPHASSRTASSWLRRASADIFFGVLDLRRRSPASCAQPKSALRPRSAASSRPSRSTRATASMPVTWSPNFLRSSCARQSPKRARPLPPPRPTA